MSSRRQRSNPLGGRYRQVSLYCITGHLLGNPWQLLDSPHDGPVMRKAFPCDGGTMVILFPALPLLWRHNGPDSVSNHQPHDCLLNRLFRRRSKKTSKLRVTGLCAGNSPGTGEFPAQMASYAENVSNWWRNHGEYEQLLKQQLVCWNVFGGHTTGTGLLFLVWWSLRLSLKTCFEVNMLNLHTFENAIDVHDVLKSLYCLR